MNWWNWMSLEIYLLQRSLKCTHSSLGLNGSGFFANPSSTGNRSCIVHRRARIGYNCSVDEECKVSVSNTLSFIHRKLCSSWSNKRLHIGNTYMYFLVFNDTRIGMLACFPFSFCTFLLWLGFLSFHHECRVTSTLLLVAIKQNDLGFPVSTLNSNLFRVLLCLRLRLQSFCLLEQP